MSFNFDNDMINYQYESVHESEYPDPLNYLNSDFSADTRKRTSLDSIVRSQEIPSSTNFGEIVGQKDELEIKKMFSVNSHENMYADDDKLSPVEHKFELSEEHRIVDEPKEVIELDSFLREHVTNGSSDAKSNSEVEKNSLVFQNFDSNDIEESSDPSEQTCTLLDMYEETNEQSESKQSQSIKISREGMRRQNKTGACTIPSSSYRQRKSDEQVKILSDLYAKHNGKLSRKVRKEAMAKTGLAWIQIYKWFFDRQLKKSAIEKACCTQYPGQIFRVIGKDGREIGKPQPIFLVEKVVSRQK